MLVKFSVGCFHRSVRRGAGPRRGGGRIWHGERHGLLAREELVGPRMGRGGLHQNAEKFGQHTNRKMWDRNGGFLPHQERRVLEQATLLGLRARCRGASRCLNGFLVAKAKGEFEVNGWTRWQRNCVLFFLDF